MIDFLRHAQTDFNTNKDKITKDIGINEFGMQQCERLRSLSKSYDVIICSTMRRCRETLELSGITAKNKLMFSQLCREHKLHACDFLEGENDQQIETEEELLERVLEFRKYLKSFETGTLLVVTHGDFIWYYTSKVVDGERFGKWVDNCQILSLDDL